MPSYERIQMKRLRTSLTYSNVISTLCLFLLVGGGAAWAATQLPKNSVGAKQLKQGAVTSAKLKKGAVTPAKLSQSTKAALVGPAGPQGPKGDPGAPATALWAEISADAKVLKGSGVTGASQPFEPGTYQVDFNRDVRGCVYQATAAHFPGAIMLVEPRDNTPNAVYVEATDSYEGVEVPTQFSLTVFC
jgi:hypothetical protein